MAGDGLPIKQIVRMTGLSRNLVRQIRRGEREDAFRLRQSSLEPWLPWLTREWEDCPRLALCLQLGKPRKKARDIAATHLVLGHLISTAR